ncbi:MAG: serine hydrolase [Adhaeribacter sp.]
MFRMIVLLVFLFFLYAPAWAQQRTDELLKNILQQADQPSLEKVLAQPGEYRLQIIYTQINRDRKNRPSFRNYYYHYDPNLYFNPASMVKMPLAFLALEKVKTLQRKGINKFTTLVFDSSHSGQRPLYRDPGAENGLPSLAHLIKRAFLVSENDPYNRLYQFMGQQQINRRLHAIGYPGTRITRQFMGFSQEQNRHTNALRFLDPAGKTLYRQGPAYNPDSMDFSQVVRLGRAYVNNQDSLVPAPFDFTRHNNISLEDLQQMLQAVMVPASVPRKKRFWLSEDDYSFLRRYLSQYPSETPYPKYDTTQFYDSYLKFFFRGQNRHMPQQVRVFNKVGWAYGFLTDVSYVVDFSNKVEYMLAATVYVNSDGVLNDGKYDYDEVGHPFLYALGQAIYRYELARPRLFQPDLSGFRLPYEKRDPLDSRPVVQEVDN